MLIDLADAKAFVQSELPLLDAEKLPIADSAGSVTTSDIISGEFVPPFNNSAMDGFAVFASDFAGESTAEDHRVRRDLVVIGTVAAGDPRSLKPGPGQCVRIMTGAVLPEGTDAIVIVEDSEVRQTGDGSEVVRLLGPVESAQHVRRAGEDLKPGDIAIPAGTELSAGHLGVLATLGMETVSVRRVPRVGVISTGDELVDDGSPLQPGQIRDSNRIMLLELCRQSGFTAVDLGLVPDDEAQIEAALVSGARTCDALVTSGGVSMGDYDYVKSVLSRIGDMRWMQIAIKPAKPFAFGYVDGCAVFGLPGNPVSSLVSYELLARPALRKMMGCSRPDRLSMSAVLDDDFSRRPDGKTHFVRVLLSNGADGTLLARRSGAQGSHQMSSTAGADGLVVLLPGDGLPRGSVAEVIPL